MSRHEPNDSKPAAGSDVPTGTILSLIAKQILQDAQGTIPLLLQAGTHVSLPPATPAAGDQADAQPSDAGPELAAGPAVESKALAAGGGGDDQDAAAGGMTWQDVQDELDRRRLKGERFTSRRKMAESIGCSPFQIQKAVKKGTIELQQWASKEHGASRLNAAPEAAAVAFENKPQAREPDPADILDANDIDAAMAYLLDQAAPDERARINAMTAAERRRLAEIVYRDPDQEEQILRRRRAKKRLRQE